MQNRARNNSWQLIFIGFLLCAGAAASVSGQAQNSENSIVLKPAETIASLVAEASNHGKQKHYDEALEAYRRALGLAPADARIYNNLGVTYAYLERFAEAAEALEQSIN